MRRLFSWSFLVRLLCTALAVNVSLACSSHSPQKVSTSPVELDPNPQTLVLYAEIHYPGVPLPTRTPTDRYCAFLPSLLVWGDGYAFLDKNAQNTEAAVWSGYLGRTTMQAVSSTLNANGFFSGWQAPGPNPAGTWLKLGAKPKDQSAIEYMSGELEPALYLRLVEVVEPELTPISGQAQVDQRVAEILESNENCNAYMYSP